MAQFYILIAALILVACVGAQTILDNARKHQAQREIQLAKWRARLDELHNNSDLLVNPPAPERSRAARAG